jgi:hypothetical protein
MAHLQAPQKVSEHGTKLIWEGSVAITVCTCVREIRLFYSELPTALVKREEHSLIL